jgi:uncharacterized membrane protein YkoI
MRKTALIITSATVVASVAGGAAAFAATSSTASPTPAPAASTPAPAPAGSSADLDAAIEAALAEVGAGTVLEADTDDDATHAYEIDVLLDAGGVVEVKLDDRFAVVSVEPDDSDGSDDDAGEADDDADDDRVTDPAVVDAASAAALAHVGEGTVTGVEASDDADHAWEVEIDLPDGTDVDVELDADYKVVTVD